ncbi:NADH-quinone oxidoreductase subunit N [Marinicrinis sediminis]|uniref:NADH-quinone oxidoreductase subunit N n=1 Tax=Marinicrinis sediminis TaxID=1652465 RepID=A0ABW5RBT3_9BACL
MRLQASDLTYLGPELTLIIAAVLISLIDLLMPGRMSRKWLGWLTLGALFVSGIFTVMSILSLGGNEPKEAIILLGQSYRIDDFAHLFKLLFLSGTVLIVLMSMGSIRQEGIRHEGEYYYLYLPAVLGAFVMASSGDLITLFVGLELLSITSYILVAMKKSDKRSNEAAFKYVVMGGIASAFILYGMSFLYGMTGSTSLAELSVHLQKLDESFHAMIYLSFFLMLAGFGVKIAAAPFHAWSPDVYQGAPTPVTAFLAVISKGAAFAMLFRIVYNAYLGVGYRGVEEPMISDDLFLSLLILAAVAMIVGNTMALRQHNSKRLMAYSGIANAGYLLVPLAVQFQGLHYSGVSELIYYLVAYGLMNIGMLAVIMLMSQSVGHGELRGFSGLYYRAPWTAVATLVLILSLAGLPITAGFFGKLYILLGALHTKTYWLAVIMIVTSVISYFYYFGIARQMFMRSNSERQDVARNGYLQTVIWFCAAATVLLGLFPQWIIGWISDIFQLSFDFFTNR